ncbi:hypothetical protein CHS0354_029976 [Potamilus streckersoni]|uniref:Uncharacterized protein n=1 Tax=Potamilus streckersoni TaxID=2493646 RepID=A0AAE0WE49_9BIVA|nr:hypothetical protein CHS0354_029976 [Potamilus streckersoni]
MRDSVKKECEIEPFVPILPAYQPPAVNNANDNSLIRLDQSFHGVVPNDVHFVPYIPNHLKNSILHQEITNNDALKINGTPGCNISLAKEAVTKFRHEVWYNNWNFVSLHLTLPDNSILKGRNIVVGPSIWIWTFYGKKGALEFLNWPIEFGIWSMRFLNTYSGDLPKFKLKVEGNCTNLVVGDEETNYAISNALKETADAMQNLSEIYGPSFWCYKERMYITPDFIYHMCLHMFCPVEALKYRCCKYFFNMESQRREITCKEDQIFTYDVLWWIFPTIVATLLFAFSPLLLMKMACRICKLTESFRVKGPASDKSYEEISDEIGDQSGSGKGWIFYTDKNVVSLFSSLFLPMCQHLMGHGRKVSIVARVLVPIFSLSIIVLQIILDWIYLRDFVIEGVQKGVPMGFRSMIAGFNDSKRNCLRFVGGPFIACGLYLLITGISLALPHDLSLFLERGIIDIRDVPTSAIRLDFRSIERLGSVTFCNKTGYKKIYRLFLAQFYMLINMKFWKEASEMQRQRWNQVHVRGRRIILLPYVLLCVMELTVCFLYYGLPILPFTVTIIRAYCGHLLKLVNNYRLTVFRYIGYLLLVNVTVAILFFVYMFCTIFLDACLFFSRVCIFTTTGIILYPKTSYGYLIFVFTIIYYLWDSVKEYSEIYQRLLKIVIRICILLQQYNTGKPLVISHRRMKGVREDIFEHVIERHCPYRKQVFVSLVKVILILVILGLSLNLLVKTDTFKELHVVMHVGTALFICAFPKIFRSMCCGYNNQFKSRRQREKISKTVRTYLGYIPGNYLSGYESDNSDASLASFLLVPERHDTLPINFATANNHC